MDEFPQRPIQRTNRSSWPPPDPSTRVGPRYFSPYDVYGTVQSPPAVAKKRRGALFASILAVAALAFGTISVALVNHSTSTATAPTTTTLPVDTTPSTSDAPVLAPTTTVAPDTQVPDTSPVLIPTDTSGTPATSATPATPANDTPTTTGGTATSKRESLSVGVVDIMTVLKYDQAEAAGTGMVLSASGEILTNNHVVQGSTSISVTVVSTGRTYTASVVGTDKTHDVAVLQLKGASGLATARIGDSSTVKVGDAVVGVGNAGGKGGQPTVAPGNVTALDQSITATDESGGTPEELTGLIQVDAALQPGESGGPLYNAAGEVIGMDTAGSAVNRRATATEGFAIPINAAMKIADGIRSGTPSATVTMGLPSFLGIGATDNLSGAGAVISNVVVGSPADKIGLVPGDIIIAIDGKSIANQAAVGPALHVHKAGEKASITWTDSAGKRHTASATLIIGPAD